MRFFAPLLAVLVFSGGVFGEPVITTGSLIDELTDLYQLTYFPEPGYKNIQFSSYDHRSTEPGGPGWHENSDGFGHEPVPNFEAVITPPKGDGDGEYLICDVVGPGAIVRLWSAAITGTIRMWLDGAERPVYEGSAEAFFAGPYDVFMDNTGLTHEVLAGTFYQRNACYAPIPFAKGCRIVWTGNPKKIHFYEVQIRKYEEGAVVTTFRPEDVKANAERIRRVAEILGDIDAKWPYKSPAAPGAIDITVAPKEQRTPIRFGGSGAIERLVLKVEAPDRDAALRQTILHVLCDEAPWGQVQAPVGDFFGAGPGINPYTSVPFSVAPDGTMTCRFVMPFRNAMRITFENRGDQDVKITGSSLFTPYSWNRATSMHFRARWRVDHGTVAAGEAVMGVQDLPFLVGRGQGMYVGTAVMLLNPSVVPHPGGSWWGEGDEKIFVDDDVRPSIFGTGSEDYFNYAWSAVDLFAHPYCGQPRNDGPANRGFVVNYRWHILDPIPFKHDVAFYMELFAHERTPGFSYARIGYHYARPGMMDDHVALTDADVRPLELPAWEPVPRGQAVNSTFQACEHLVAQTAATTIEEGGMWQGGRLLVWTPAEAGATLELPLEIPEKGTYEIQLVCRLREDGGAFTATLDGQPLAFNGDKPLALAAPHHTLSRLFSSPERPLDSGRHVVVLKAVEAGKPIGLDFFAMKKH